MEICFTDKNVYSMLKSKLKGHACTYLLGIGMTHNKLPEAIFDINRMTKDGWTLEEYSNVMAKTHGLIWDWVSSIFDDDVPTEMELVDIDMRSGDISWVVTDCLGCDCCCDECDGDCDDE